MPVFYERYAVPDTIDGRYEMIALHCFMVMKRLHREAQAPLAQKLFDAFFVNMDRSLREIGIGDLGVPKHMKRMMQGFNGRRQSYQDALDGDDREALKAALVRNVYGTIDAPSDAVLSAMADYVEHSIAIEGVEAEFASPEKFAVDLNKAIEEEKCCA